MSASLLQSDVFHDQLQSLTALVEQLRQEVSELRAENAVLRQENAELRQQVSQSQSATHWQSFNSPPKPQSLRLRRLCGHLLCPNLTTSANIYVSEFLSSLFIRVYENHPFEKVRIQGWYGEDMN